MNGWAIAGTLAGLYVLVFTVLLLYAIATAPSMDESEDI
jgi:hypothetical protein